MGGAARQGTGAPVGLLAVNELLVGLIADVKQAVQRTELVDRRQHLGRNHHAAGVIWRHGDDGPGARGDCRRQPLWIGYQARLHRDGHGTGQLHRHHVIEIKGHRQDHLAGFPWGARCDHLSYRVESHVAAGCNQQLSPCEVEVVLVGELGGDCRQQLWITQEWPVTVQRWPPGRQGLGHGKGYARWGIPAHHSLGQRQGAGGLVHQGRQLRNDWAKYLRQPLAWAR